VDVLIKRRRVNLFFIGIDRSLRSDVVKWKRAERATA
jgi:hypothetical protein